MVKRHSNKSLSYAGYRSGIQYLYTVIPMKAGIQRERRNTDSRVKPEDDNTQH